MVQVGEKWIFKKKNRSQSDRQTKADKIDNRCVKKTYSMKNLKERQIEAKKKNK